MTSFNCVITSVIVIVIFVVSFICIGTAEDIYQNITIDDPTNVIHLNTTPAPSPHPTEDYTGNVSTRGVSDRGNDSGAQFIKLFGTVRVYNPCTSPEGIPATLDTVLHYGDYVFTDDYSNASIRMPDGLTISLLYKSELLIGDPQECTPNQVPPTPVIPLNIPPTWDIPIMTEIPTMNPTEKPTLFPTPQDTIEMQTYPPTEEPTYLPSTLPVTPEPTDEIQTPPITPAYPEGCTWTGTWMTSYDTMTLIQSGSSVSGSYEHNNGQISGTARGNEFVGTWQETADGLYSGPIELTMSEDCNSFSGYWKYTTSDSWNGEWTGQRI